MYTTPTLIARVRRVFIFPKFTYILVVVVVVVVVVVCVCVCVCVYVCAERVGWVRRVAVGEKADPMNLGLKICYEDI